MVTRPESRKAVRVVVQYKTREKSMRLRSGLVANSDIVEYPSVQKVAGTRDFAVESHPLGDTQGKTSLTSLKTPNYTQVLISFKNFQFWLSGMGFERAKFLSVYRKRYSTFLGVEKIFSHRP